MKTRLKNQQIWSVLGLVAVITWAGYSYRGALGAARAAAQRAAEPESIPKLVYVSTPITPLAARTWLALSKRVPMHFPDEKPFDEVLQYIRDSTKDVEGLKRGIPIYVEPIRTHGEFQMTMSVAITLDLEDVPLATTLDLVVRQLGLTYTVTQDGLVVISSENDESKPLSDPYPTMLNQLTDLRTEVAALRRELAEMRRAN
jgi:hypothetical protein